MGAGGLCNHVIALRLTWIGEPDWIGEPETFAETQMLEAHLQQHSKDQLIILIDL